MNLIDGNLDGQLSVCASNANYGYSATFHTSREPLSAASSIHTFIVNALIHGSNLNIPPSPEPLVTACTYGENERTSRNTSSTPLPSPTNIDVENGWPNLISTTHSRETNNILCEINCKCGAFLQQQQPI